MIAIAVAAELLQARAKAVARHEAEGTMKDHAGRNR
jgi:xanthine/CO dehydrogenase XdhC/CoxF family maturation factor